MSHIVKRERPTSSISHWMGLSLAAVLSSIPTSARTFRGDDAPRLSSLSGWFLSTSIEGWSIASAWVIGPSHDVLDQHLQRGFFRRATQQVLPYGDMRFHAARLVEAYQRLLIRDRLRPFDQRVA